MKCNSKYLSFFDRWYMRKFLREYIKINRRELKEKLIRVGNLLNLGKDDALVFLYESVRFGKRMSEHSG